MKGIKLNGKVLERKINENFMHPASFARKIGKHRSTVAAYIKEERCPLPDDIPLLAKALKCKPEELIKRQEV